VWIVVFSTLAFGAIGFADDYVKVVERRSLGLTARAKLLWQGFAGALVAVALVVLEQFKVFSTQLSVPFIKSLRPDLLWHYWPATIPHLGLVAFLPFVVWVMLWLAGTSNAVNLTDGLDGLAIGCSLIASAALAVLAYVSGHVVFADYLELQRMPMVGELTVFCGSWVFSGTTRTRPRSSWATWARWRWAAPSAPWPSSSGRNCCCPSSAASLYLRRSR
jgi:phospho-N-acetylmuramoyl-pentapeptide-transferase